MNIITLAIQNKSGGKRGMSGVAGVSRLLWGGSFSIHDTALTPTLTTTTAPTNPRTINGIAVSATQATRTSDTLGPTIWGLWDNYQTAVSGGWQGTRLPFTADVDMRDKLLAVEFFGDLGSFFDQEGIIIVLEDSTQTNWRAFQVHQRLGWVRNKPYTAIIDLTGATIYDEGGTFDPQYVRSITPLVHRLPVTTARGFGMRNWSLLSKSILTGGNSAAPLTINFLRKLLGGFSLAGLVGGDAPAATVKTDVQIGDGGTTPTYFDATGTLLTFPAPYDPLTQREWQVGTPRTVTLSPGASDTLNAVAGSLVTTTAQNLTMDPAGSTSAAFSAAALVVAGPWVASLRPGFDYAGMTIKGGTINLAAAGIYEFIVAQDTTINFTPTGASTYVMGDCSITGTLDLRNTTAHAITVELPSGAATDDSNNTGGAITVVTPTSSITFDDMIAGGTLKVFTTGTQTELFSDTNTATSEVWTGASGTFDYTWIKEGYRTIRATGEVVSGSRTITLQPVVDRAYVASSGLTFGTNLFYAPGTKLAGLTVASTLQNLYSALIAAFRVEATLQNKPFPLAANGPNSFSWLDGNAFDLTTYPNSITLLSRDGMRYLDTGGAATDIWAAVLSVGVPTGFQVRYQQQDGLGTTNAQNTGNIDQLIKIKKTGTGAFDYTGWLVLKCQEEGYDQAEAIAADIYGTLEDQLYVFGLTPIPNGIAAGATDATVTVTAEPTPVEWPAASGKYFSTTIKDTTDAHSGLQIMQAVRAENQFNWSDLVRPNGDKFKTVTGNFYGDAYATPAGVRVVKADGVTPHQDFNLFNDDTGSNPYTPPVAAPVTWAGAEDGTTVLLYNDKVGGGLIAAATVAGTSGGYTWSISLPHADVAAGDSLRLRFGHKQYYAGELQGTMTASGLAFVGSMTLHPVYAAWGLDGEVYDQGYTPPGPYTMDGVNLQVDIAAGATTGLKTQLGAWTQYLMTLPAGLDAFYGAWDLLELNQIRQNVTVVDVLLDLPVSGAQFAFTDNEVNYYRSDFTLPYNIEAGHGNIFLTYNAKPFVALVSVGGSPMTTDDRDTILAAIPSASTNATATRSELAIELGRLDAAVSSRASGAAVAALPTGAQNAAATRSELAVELADVVRARKLLNNKRVVDPDTGLLTVYDDDGTTVLGSGLTYLDAAGTQPYDGSAPVHRTEAVE